MHQKREPERFLRTQIACEEWDEDLNRSKCHLDKRKFLCREFQLSNEKLSGTYIICEIDTAKVSIHRHRWHYYATEGEVELDVGVLNNITEDDEDLL